MGVSQQSRGRFVNNLRGYRQLLIPESMSANEVVLGRERCISEINDRNINGERREYLNRRSVSFSL